MNVARSERLHTRTPCSAVETQLHTARDRLGVRNLDRVRQAQREGEECETLRGVGRGCRLGELVGKHLPVKGRQVARARAQRRCEYLSQLPDEGRLVADALDRCAAEGERRGKASEREAG